MRIGIVTPAYNAAPWIGDAICSVLAQSYPEWTMVVVDDGSTDGTADVVAGFPDERIRLIRQENAGVSTARNRGTMALEADAWLFLDADDWLAPDALVRLVAALDAAPYAVAAVGAFAFVVASGRTLRVRQPIAGGLLEELLRCNCFANGGHVLLRHAAVSAAGLFQPHLAYGEDWEYWIRIALQGPFAAAAGTVPVLFVRQRPGSAYDRFARDPAAFAPCMVAIFANPALQIRFGSERLAAIRRQTEAENAWIVGRELICHHHRGEGRAWLRRSFLAQPSIRRAALLATAHALPLVPGPWRGPFRRYGLRDVARSPPRSGLL